MRGLAFAPLFQLRPHIKSAPFLWWGFVCLMPPVSFPFQLRPQSLHPCLCVGLCAFNGTCFPSHASPSAIPSHAFPSLPSLCFSPPSHAFHSLPFPFLRNKGPKTCTFVCVWGCACFMAPASHLKAPKPAPSRLLPLPAGTPLAGSSSPTGVELVDDVGRQEVGGQRAAATREYVARAGDTGRRERAQGTGGALPGRGMGWFWGFWEVHRGSFGVWGWGERGC